MHFIIIHNKSWIHNLMAYMWMIWKCLCVYMCAIYSNIVIVNTVRKANICTFTQIILTQKASLSFVIYKVFWCRKYSVVIHFCYLSCIRLTNIHIYIKVHFIISFFSLVRRCESYSHSSHNFIHGWTVKHFNKTPIELTPYSSFVWCMMYEFCIF